MGGRRLHITGSAHAECDHELLRWTHEVLRGVLDRHLNSGGTILTQLGADPRTGGGLPILFDWTAIEAAVAAITDGRAEPRQKGPLVTLRGSSRGFEQIPEDRRPLWRTLVEHDAVDYRRLPDTWRSGALIRLAQAQVGDVLLVVSGGAGVEHLAELYAGRGRGVVPWKVDLGSSGSDATLGGVGLAKKALTDSQPFFRLASKATAEARLADLAVDPGALRDAGLVAADLFGLLSDLDPPHVFYVRLLNPEHDMYEMVESFFRNVVDPVIAGLGYRNVDLGREQQESAWMNAEIFEQLDRSELVIADLTGMRPNCLMELGYALGNHQRSFVTAHKSESLPFDADKLPVFSWDDEDDPEQVRSALEAHMDQYGSLPPLVQKAGFV